jgi:hypothetical protein
VRFTTASALVSELIEARDEKKLLRFQKQIASYELLIVDELGFVPLSKTGAELLFEMLSQRYERGSTERRQLPPQAKPPQTRLLKHAPRSRLVGKSLFRYASEALPHEIHRTIVVVRVEETCRNELYNVSVHRITQCLECSGRPFGQVLEFV